MNFNLPEFYSVVVSQRFAVCQKDGVNKGRSFCSMDVLTTPSYNDVIGLVPAQVFVWCDEVDVKSLDIVVGDLISPVFVGSGRSRKLKTIDVIKGNSKK